MLPLDRNHTYTPNSQLYSADMNDLQDGEINNLHGYRWVELEDLAGAFVAGSPTPSYSSFEWLVSGTGVVTVRLPLGPGMLLQKVSFRVQDGAATRVYLNVLGRKDGSDAGLVVPALVQSTLSANYEWVTMDFGASPLAVADHETMVYCELGVIGAAQGRIAKGRMLVARSSNPL